MSQPRFPRGSSQRHQQISGDNSGGETPDPIPNSEVKPSRANGTAGETLWESRSSPGNIQPRGAQASLLAEAPSRDGSGTRPGFLDWKAECHFGAPPFSFLRVPSNRGRGGPG